jgi:hypothetical protein
MLLRVAGLAAGRGPTALLESLPIIAAIFVQEFTPCQIVIFLNLS